MDSLMNKPNVETIQSLLETVIDPELGIDIFTLGLIYDINIKDNTCNVTMTYTTPMCPHGESMKKEALNTLRQEYPEINFEITITFEPKWQPSEDLRLLLGV
jgi:metal-sulfur cluster biosynthetic enzyme